MTRHSPFPDLTATATAGEATLRRLEARRQRIDDLNLAREYGMAERHARKLRRLQAKAAVEEEMAAEDRAADDPPEAA